MKNPAKGDTVITVDHNRQQCQATIIKVRGKKSIDIKKAGPEPGEIVTIRGLYFVENAPHDEMDWTWPENL